MSEDPKPYILNKAPDWETVDAELAKELIRKKLLLVPRSPHKAIPISSSQGEAITLRYQQEP